MVHHDERPANGFVCGSFFALCAAERLVGGAPSPTGRARAAVQLAFASCEMGMPFNTGPCKTNQNDKHKRARCLLLTEYPTIRTI